MSRKTLAGNHTPNKRRATSPPDSATRFVQDHCDTRRKKVKREPTPTPAPGHQDAASSVNRSTNATTETDDRDEVPESEDDEDPMEFAQKLLESWEPRKEAPVRTGSRASTSLQTTKPSKQGEEPCTTDQPGPTQDSQTSVNPNLTPPTITPPHTLLPTEVKVSPASVDKVLDYAFSTVTAGQPSAPGLAFIERRLHAFSQRTDVSASRIEEVTHIMRAGWRQRMARYLGEAITNAEEWREVLGGVVGAVPFQPAPIGLALSVLPDACDTSHVRVEGSNVLATLPLSPPASSPVHAQTNTQPSDAAVRGSVTQPAHHTADSKRKREGSSDGKANENKSNRKARSIVSRGARSEVAAPSPSKSTSTTSSAAQQTKAATAQCQPQDAAREEQVAAFKTNFPKPLDYFIHHIQQYQLHLQAHAHARKASIDSESLRQEAKAAWKGLDTAQREEWRALHKLGTRDGEEAKARKVLVEQVVVRKIFGAGAIRVETDSSVTSSSSESEDTDSSSSDSDSDTDPVLAIKQLAAIQVAKKTSASKVPLTPISAPKRQFKYSSTNTVPSASTTIEKLAALPKPNQLSKPNRPPIHPPPPPPAIKIPFPTHHLPNTNSYLAFTTATPDCPINANDLSRACNSQLGTQCLSVRSLNTYVWVAELPDARAANRAKGQSIALANGAKLTAEHLYASAPRIFIADLSSSCIRSASVAAAIASAFPNQVQHLTLRKLEGNGVRQFRLEFARSSGLMRFYVSVPKAQAAMQKARTKDTKPKNEARQEKAEAMREKRREKEKKASKQGLVGKGKNENKEWIQLCWRPLNILAACGVCGREHRTGVCGFARVVPLPQVG